jgi:anti-sigma factor RsiW
MASGADDTKLTQRELDDLSALADGTLDPARRGAVEARIAASP